MDLDRLDFITMLRKGGERRRIATMMVGREQAAELFFAKGYAQY